MEAETCTNCEEPIAHAPVFFDGRPYCCVGCVAGGPCLCTYEEPVQAARQAPRPVVAASGVPRAPQTYRAPAHSEAYQAAEAPRPAEPQRVAEDQGMAQPAADRQMDANPYRGPQPSAPPAESRPVARPSTPPPPVRPQHSAPDPYEQPRTPIPFRRPGGVAVVVHIGGFADQHQLLSFAGAMERSSDFAEVSLTRVGTDEAWLTVRAESAEGVAASLLRMPGLDLDVHVDQNLVEAHVLSSASAESGASSDQLLPQRPRFRAFRPQPDPVVRPASNTPPPPARRPQAPVARPQAPQPVPRPSAPTPVVRPPQPQAPAASAPQPAPRPMSAPTPPVATPAPQPVAQPHMQPPVAQPPQPTDVRPVAPAPRPIESPSGGPPSMGPTTSAPTAASAPPTQAAPAAPAAPTSAQPTASPRPAAPPPAVAQPAPAARPAPARIAVAEDEFVDPEDRPGGAVMTVEHMTLVVYPFHSFAALNEFQTAIRGLHGVKNTRVRRFYRGTLHLAVDYEDMIPLTDRMADLKDLEFQIASESRSELEIVLEDQSPLAAGGDS